MTTYDFKCNTCGKTELFLEDNKPEAPICCGESMRSYTWVTKRNAQLHPKDRPVVFENPQTGEVKYPPRQDSPMLPSYIEQGFKRREFTSYQEHKKWCDSHGVVNHGLEGIN
jgi:predicted RNA-binding Zn-ribbon protein involved in translation (DUF1610 family)